MPHRNKRLSGIGRAIEAAGGQAKLAEVLGVSQQFVSVCFKRGWVPVDRAIEIEAQFGISRRDTINPRLASLLDEPMAGV